MARAKQTLNNRLSDTNGVLNLGLIAEDRLEAVLRGLRSLANLGTTHTRRTVVVNGNEVQKDFPLKANKIQIDYIKSEIEAGLAEVEDYLTHGKPEVVGKMIEIPKH